MLVKKAKFFEDIEDILEDVVPFVIHDAPLFCFNKT